ncbi:hypothetical protein PtB15_1B982 [Puccinia triticina]|nr:hypothetical protein PtB15_1B982 [Puccinia triticina]
MRFTAVALAATLAFAQATAAELSTLAVEKRGIFDFLIPGGGLPETGMSCGHNRNLVGLGLGNANTCTMVNNGGATGPMRCGGAESLLQVDISQYNGCSMQNNAQADTCALFWSPNCGLLSPPSSGLFAKSTDDMKGELASISAR